jgi:GMP synthase-like glutamine amidotransferase
MLDSGIYIGPEFEEIGHSVTGDTTEHRYAAIGSVSMVRYGFQFHPEVDDTELGDEMITNFVF